MPFSYATNVDCSSEPTLAPVRINSPTNAGHSPRRRCAEGPRLALSCPRSPLLRISITISRSPLSIPENTTISSIPYPGSRPGTKITARAAVATTATMVLPVAVVEPAMAMEPTIPLKAVQARRIEGLPSITVQGQSTNLLLALAAADFLSTSRCRPTRWSLPTARPQLPCRVRRRLVALAVVRHRRCQKNIPPLPPRH